MTTPIATTSIPVPAGGGAPSSSSSSPSPPAPPPRSSFAATTTRPSLIHHYKKGEVTTLRRVLDEIDEISGKRTKEGFNEFNFTLGVCNCFFIAYMFGAHPEHIWLIYLVEGMYMIPRKFYTMWHAKPLNQALYYLDFCWCMNFTGMLFIGLLLLAGQNVDDATRRALFSALLGISCGPLTGANIVLPFVSCLFHDVNTMTGLFIHLMPPMVVYTFMWHTPDILRCWPNIFHLTYMDELEFYPTTLNNLGSSVVGNAIGLYLFWWVPYIGFMLLFGGINLPKKYQRDGITPAHPRWDTVFHSTMRQGVSVAIGKVFRGRTKTQCLQLNETNNFDWIDFIIYMICHMIASVASIVVIAYHCFSSRRFHLFILAFAMVLAVTRGAHRYTYYVTTMYSKSLRREFASILEEIKDE